MKNFQTVAGYQNTSMINNHKIQPYSEFKLYNVFHFFSSANLGKRFFQLFQLNFERRLSSLLFQLEWLPYYTSDIAHKNNFFCL